MGIRDVEAEILAELRTVTGIESLRLKDIAEWTSGKIKPRDGETVVDLPVMGVTVAYVQPTKKKAKKQ